MGNLTETMNLLAEAGADKTSSYLSKRPSPATMVETLLSAFNNNPHNTRTAEYLFRQNLFELIGKSRHEMVHSRMIAELLAGRYYDISKKMTLMHFFDIVVMRAKEQGVSVPQEFLDAVLTRSLTIESLVDRQTEYPLNSYIKDYANNAGCDVDNKKRLDIFLRYNLASTLKKSGNKIVEIFIENKVLSNEHNQQTQTYYDICADNRRALQLFIYLSPITQKELNDYTNISDNMKPSAVDKSGKPVFIHICYQDILDRIIAPLMNGESMNERDTVILGEYANCLELPSLPDSDDKKLQAKELSIMAIGNKLKLMLTEFMKSEENARLLEAA
ncbi:MAG: PD-(D/E)XK nuclease family protein, partial [Muribaculaceae bacterium]|nr:PD-(D/E)XK nuclease family protein [Muribaculaceae bacterium]